MALFHPTSRPRLAVARTTRPRRLVAVALVAISLATPTVIVRPASAQVPPDGVRYQPPVDAPIIDRFRPPSNPFGPGNRGLSYGVAPLTPIRAAGAGEVIFAGQVGGALHVTIRHADGLRTSYSFLAAISVRTGAVVVAGSTIGWSSEVFHFGVRAPDGTYLDPELLWAGAWEPRLVPGGDDGAAPPTEPATLLALVRERTGPLAAWLASGGATLQDATAATRAAFDRRLLLWMHYAIELQPAVHAQRLVDGVERWRAQRDRCTATDAPVIAPGGRRIVIEVAGIGSTSDGAAVAELDTAALGYAPGDVIRFSYVGGRVPPPGGVADDPFATVTTTEYDAVASQDDLEHSGHRLAVLLDDVATAAPGVPIDVIAHSQGGVVARLALRDAAAAGTLPGAVEHLITLGSPHQGADLATTIEAAGIDPAAAAALDGARQVAGIELDPALPAASQLSEVSPIVLGLADEAVPPGVAFRSIAARGDVVVTEGRTWAPGATHSTVSLVGISAHDRLPSSAEATREVALVLADRPPTCRSLADMLVDVGVGDGIGLVTDAAGATALGASLAAPG